MATRLDVLVVDDEAAMRDVLSLRLADWGHAVRTVGDPAAALREVDVRTPDVILCDVVLPGSSGLALLHRVREAGRRMPVVMITAHGSIDAAVEAMKCGAADFLTKPLDHGALRALLDGIERRVRDRRASRALNLALDHDAVAGGGGRAGNHALVGRSPAMRDLRRIITTLASSDAAAIVTGESGTGKEVVARAVHAHSSRRDKPFIAVNAAAIPEGLIESEVFGHEQGAFTGATRSRAGCFELAEGGTLFLDEIAEMPIALQPKLLRVLETGRARRLGGSRELTFDVRVLAATNRPAREAIRDGQLREDLYYRLSVFEIVVPALRARPDDVPLLAQHFVRLLGDRHQIALTGVAEPALALLAAHAWPGNVRELRNVIERAVITARGDGEWIEPRHLPPYLRAGKPGASPTLTLPAGTTLADAERSVILHTLDRVDGNKAAAARQLGLDVKTIRNKLRAYGLAGPE